MALNKGQQLVADQFMEFMMDENQNEMVIQGHAGTGKSYLTLELMQQVDKQLKMLSLLMGTDADAPIEILVTATTNKAARIIADVTNQDPQTIHSLLGISPFTNYSTGKKSLRKSKNYQVRRDALLIIDEASFIDDMLLKMIRESTINCKVLYIGDPYQLAPVNATSIPVFEKVLLQGTLTELVRNPGPIGTLSGLYREVLQGKDWPTIKPNGKDILHVDGPTFRSMIDKEYSDVHALPHLRSTTDDNHARILAWSNERVVQYNEYVREMLGYSDTLVVGERVISNNFMPLHKISVDAHLTVTHIGEETTLKGVDGNMIQVDNYNTFFVPRNTKDALDLCKGLAKRKNWMEFYQVKEQWGDLRPMYASTVHKSQGSTYDTVFIDLDDIGRCNSPEDVARLMYVAISRARVRVVFYGNLPAKYGGPSNV